MINSRTNDDQTRRGAGKKTPLSCRVLSNERVAGTIYKLVFVSGELAAAAPGQFVMLKCGDGVYLRRPFSICDTDVKTQAATVMYGLTGAGTRLLSMLKKGDALDVVGPLGNGYELPPGGCGGGTSAVIGGGTAAVIGGGIGVFPLLLLSKRLNEISIKPDIYTGYRNADCVVLEREFLRLSGKYALMSDDGSAGDKGFVTDAFAAALERGEKYGAVYACGPAPMLKTLQSICAERGINAQFSLEQRMGCGIGACLSCACALKSGEDNEAYFYARVCRDGPVFFSDDVIFP